MYDPGVSGGDGNGKAITMLGCAGGLKGTYDLAHNSRMAFLVLGYRLVWHCPSAWQLWGVGKLTRLHW